MSAARRSLLTAAAAGSLLGALWFIPTAHATTDTVTPAARAQPYAAPAAHGSRAATDAAPATLSMSPGAPAPGAVHTTNAQGPGHLADTGAVDTTPYLIGGTLFLGLGAAFVVHSMRRARELEFDLLVH